MSSFEMNELSDRKPAQETEEWPEETQPTVEDTVNEAIYPWTWSAAAVLSTLAATFSLFPRVLLFLSETDGTMDRGRTQLTPLESFLAVHFGIWLFAISLGLVLNTPGHPVITPRANAPPTHPLLVPLTLAGLLTAFLSWNTKTVGSLATLSFLGTGSIALWGLWVIAFGTASSYSKKTGADKHTSSFIFGNKASASKQKKKWRKEKGI